MKYDDEDIKPSTYLKTNSAALIEGVNKKGRPVIITQNGEARAVVQDLRQYQEQKNALLLLKMVAIGESQIKHGELIEQAKLFSRIDRKLNS